MKLCKKIVELQNELFEVRKKGQSVGLVPTMGALHDGHVSLVKRSIAENDVTIVSVFLNPTQFNDKKDLERYPQNLDADCELLEKCGADYVFAPTVKEMYPVPDKRRFDFPPVTSVMEGAHRPGHFNGVCQVVSRLFYITKPDAAYFGEKDWQQIAVIKQLVKSLGLKIKIVECELIREESGLAMSSRNALLTAEERDVASNIYRVLKESVSYATSHSVQETHDFVVNSINTYPELKVEYFSIVNNDTLEDVAKWDDCPGISGCITVFCGRTPIRLIDHIAYKE
ncbi:pantoate--beta-alanine ligase [Leyella lascolaii]|uniref:pantoate--beta-alanine ligase n=1 Tax=Leyella lascolaii TaxID=1776379 RepID=UPI002942E68C|nr:pantoate--beta-alanine ligase [Leyella lascolaii]